MDPGRGVYRDSTAYYRAGRSVRDGSCVHACMAVWGVGRARGGGTGSKRRRAPRPRNRSERARGLAHANIPDSSGEAPRVHPITGATGCGDTDQLRHSSSAWREHRLSARRTRTRTRGRGTAQMYAHNLVIDLHTYRTRQVALPCGLYASVAPRLHNKALPGNLIEAIIT
jgi:hypothetical protein